MKTSVAIILLLVCLSGMTINQADGLIIDCNWGGCPSHKACNFCCRHLHGLKRCISGKCVKRRPWALIKTKCKCTCPSSG
ncbi:Hypothetical predicted protein [Mytilus galloprovincialis]|uniref:Uncharacterized protein n=1 Tax=Mytilus galloprovincialis TaxID=29158 RepID=A0A8B6C1K5_MYTGA|nr:Hypothetical predicted protein [Mytilus galloprovincialis]